jgi:hypothetical protein
MERPGALVGSRAGGRDDTGTDPLALGAGEMRELGYRTIDLLVRRLTDEAAPAMRRGARPELSVRMDSSVPDHPRAWSDLLGVEQSLEWLAAAPVPIAGRSQSRTVDRRTARHGTDHKWTLAR